MKVALVHEWLVDYSGSERVYEQMRLCFPDADLYSVVDFVPEKDRAFLGGKKPFTTFIQKLPFASKKYRNYLPLMPLAIEQLDLSQYDLIISSSHAVAKGVLTGPDQLHICMCYSPIRYAWDLQHQYLSESGLTRGLRSMIARWLLHRIRIWDCRTANGVDEFIAISQFIARRIARVYRRASRVIYPPVDVNAFEFRGEKHDFYMTASRMAPYKRIGLIVDAFTAMSDKKLIVIGDGTEFASIRKRAGPNVTMLGYQPFHVMRDHMQRARAFVFAAEEDFGIAPIEAQSCGTPVIAYGRGGALETIIGRPAPGQEPTGVFFGNQTVESLCEAVVEFETRASEIKAEACRANALRFSPERFRAEFVAYVDEAVANRHERLEGHRC
jgi:glycosyltransferase involved in cell wall biosynthesis